MKSYLLIFLVALSPCLLVYPVSAADAVEPAAITITNVRDEVVANASEVFYYKGTTLRLTNCVILVGGTNSARQGLSDVTIQLKIGNAVTSTPYAGTAQVASNGTWSCNAVVPTNEGMCYLQVKITDADTNSYIFSWKVLNRKDPL